MSLNLNICGIFKVPPLRGTLGSVVDDHIGLFLHHWEMFRLSKDRLHPAVNIAPHDLWPFVSLAPSAQEFKHSPHICRWMISLLKVLDHFWSDLLEWFQVLAFFDASVEFSISTSPTKPRWHLQLRSFVSHYTKTTIWSGKCTNPKGKTCWKLAETASGRMAALSFN